MGVFHSKCFVQYNYFDKLKIDFRFLNMQGMYRLNYIFFLSVNNLLTKNLTSHLPYSVKRI